MRSERTIQKLVRVAKRGAQRRQSNPNYGARIETSSLFCHRDNLSEFARKDFVKDSRPLQMHYGALGVVSDLSLPPFYAVLETGCPKGICDQNGTSPKPSTGPHPQKN